MDPRDRLRLALLGSGCARCGRPYPAQGIKVLAQRDEIAFVQLVCFSCQVQTLALITGVHALGQESSAPEVETEPAASTGRGPAGLPGDGTAITEDDVLEMHSFLSSYEGGIDGLLRPFADPAADDDEDGGHAGRGEGSAG